MRIVDGDDVDVRRVVAKVPKTSAASRYSGVNLYARLAEDGSAKTAESIDSNLNIGEKQISSADFEIL